MPTDGRRYPFDERSGAAFIAGNGAFDVVSGVIMLIVGVPAGSGCFVIGCGVALLAGAALVALDIDVTPTRDSIIAMVIAIGLFAIAALYLTHRAEDLPRLVPGHDSDSQHSYALQGAGLMFLGCHALRVAYLRASPQRPPIG